MNIDEQAALYQSFMATVQGMQLCEPELLNVTLLDPAGRVSVHRGSDHFTPFPACRQGWSFRNYRHTSYPITCRRCLAVLR